MDNNNMFLAANGADLGTTIHPGDVLVLPE